jgi:hypothetical protein
MPRIYADFRVIEMTVMACDTVAKKPAILPINDVLCTPSGSTTSTAESKGNAENA